MGEVTARPAALAAFADELIGPDAALRDRAADLDATLLAYLRTNPDFGRDHTVLADGLATMSGLLVALDQHVGATAEAFRRLDGAGFVSGTPAAVDAGYQAVTGTITDLRDALLPIDQALWRRLVFGTWMCPRGAFGTYRGGGAVRGPDGRLYPLVVPELSIDGEFFHSTTGADPRFDPMTMGGSDLGWTRVALLTGVARRWDEPAALDRWLAGAGAAAGHQGPAHRWLSPEMLAHMRISPQGWPSFSQPERIGGRRPVERHGPLEFDAPSVPLRDPRDGRIIDADPTRVDQLSRWLRREFQRQYGNGYTPAHQNAQQNTAAGAAAIDLITGLANGYQLSSSMDDVNHVAYQIVLEEQVDSGRRRAVARTYSAVSEGGPINIVPELVHLDDAEVARTPMRFHQADGPSVRSAPTTTLPSVVIQRPNP